MADSSNRPAYWSGSGKRSVQAIGKNPSAADAEGPEATDAAVALAAELGVDLASVTGTGKDGKITVSDVDAAAAADVED